VPVPFGVAAGRGVLEEDAVFAPSASCAHGSRITGVGAILGGHRPASCSDSERCPAINLQLDMTFWVAGGLVGECSDVYGKEKVYGSIP
jgi:hypothetical protein